MRINCLEKLLQLTAHETKDAQRSFRSYRVLTGLWKFVGKVTRLRTQNFVAMQTWLKTEK